MPSNILQRAKDRFWIHRYLNPFAKKNAERRVTNENTICLFCQPRSGSAWFSEIIASIPQSGIIDEPLWRGAYGPSDEMPKPENFKLPEAQELGFYFNQPIAENETWTEAQALFEKLFQGRQISPYLYEEMDIKNMSKYETYIFKFNKANLLMHWLIKHFDFKALALMRHPCATIASQIEGGFYDSAKPIAGSITPAFRNSDYFKKYAHIWKSINTQEEYLAFIWAINTIEVMNHPDRNKAYLIVSYESLLTQFKAEIERIFRFLERPIPVGIVQLHSKISLTTKTGSIQFINSNRQLGAWREKLSQSKIESILRVVDAFGIDYYNKDLEPDLNKVYTSSSS